VTASDALADSRPLVDLGSIGKLSNPLPGVLPTIGEEDVGCSDFVAPVVVISSIYSRELRHVELRENHLTVCEPVVVVHVFRTNAMKLRRSLEPSELCAVLISPRPPTVININFGGVNLRARSRVVALWSIASSDVGFDHCVENLGI
jgi:hypothetical protein